MQHPTDEDLLYAAMLLNDQPLEETLLEDGSMLHLADATSFSDAERERSVTRQVCAAAGCTLLCRPRGRLCVKHQKQRERGRQPFELKDPNIVLSKGRPPLPFSKSNKRKKLQRLDQLLTELGGGKEEGTLYLQTYLESDFWKARNTANVHDHSRLFSLVGRMLLSEVPPMHPLRAQLNALFTEEQIKEAMQASEVARSHAAHLPPFTDAEQVPEQLL